MRLSHAVGREWRVRVSVEVGAGGSMARNSLRRRAGRSGCWRVLFVMCALAGLAGTGSAVAQSLPPEGSAARAEYEQLFEQSLANPADLDAAFRFAEAATALGDYEAAIGALERMLFFNPNLSRVRLELGVLYFRLGSYAQARAYLTSAVAPAETPADVRERVGLFLAEIDKRDQPSRLSGFAQVGVRHQSNANAGPASLNVRAGGSDALLDQRFGRRPDWNAFALGGLRHVYDLGTQRGDTWESSADIYSARQFRANELDVDLGEFATGPRLALGLDTLPGASIRPYAVVGGLRLGNAHYLASFGAGAGVTAPFGRGVLEASAELRWREFNNSARYPTAEQQSGHLANGFVTYTRPLAANLRIQLRGTLSVNTADEDYFSYVQGGGSMGVAWDVAAPIGPYRWVITPSAGILFTTYDAPNAIVDPGMTRKDQEYRVSVSLDAPLTSLLGISVTLQYARNASNLPNYRYSNTSIMVGPTLRF